MRKTLTLCCMLVALGVKAQSLNDYLEMAATNNPGLKAKYKMYLAALESVDESASLPDPTISFGYFISPIETRVGPQQFRFSLGQMFPWKGTLPLRKKAATQLAKVRFEEFIDARNQLFLEVQLNWLELFELEQEIQITRENLEILKTFESVTKTKYEANLVSLADLVRVQIRIDEANTDLSLLELKRTPLKGNFNLLLNRELDQNILLNDTIGFLVTHEPKLDSALVHAPLLKAARLKIEIADTKVALAKKHGKPNVGLGLDYVVVGQRSDVVINENGKDILIPTVSLSLPIFKKKHHAVMNAAKRTKESREESLIQLENELKNDWISLQYERTKALDLIGLYKDEIEKTNLLVRVLTTEYTNNNRDFEEVLAAQQRLLMLKLSLVRAELQYRTSVYQLESLASNTLTEFK